MLSVSLFCLSIFGVLFISIVSIVGTIWIVGTIRTRRQNAHYEYIKKEAARLQVEKQVEVTVDKVTMVATPDPLAVFAIGAYGKQHELVTGTDGKHQVRFSYEGHIYCVTSDGSLWLALDGVNWYKYAEADQAQNFYRSMRATKQVSDGSNKQNDNDLRGQVKALKRELNELRQANSKSRKHKPSDAFIGENDEDESTSPYAVSKRVAQKWYDEMKVWTVKPSNILPKPYFFRKDNGEWCVDRRVQEDEE